ncbi:MAG: hypothetical protein H2042_10975 [Rhizobiales bacterium]|uniref:hypothetical protein n=1 Tax=Aquabacter cavernae TaxID=2496029 RepID=UPI000F8DE2CD|nr:hypothetical protein [Aquabacter cavernae]MBA4790209.1 hypothetical protein [Hyphomicrobiales bacterium]
MKVWLINPKTGALKHAPVKASSLHSTLAVWAVLAVCLIVLTLFEPPSYSSMLRIIWAPMAAFSIFITHRRLGKSMYLRGWRFADPDGLDARMARAQWDLPPVEAPSERPSMAAPFVLNEAAFLAEATLPASAPPQAIRMPRIPHMSGGTNFMRFIMYAVAVLAFLAGILSVVSMRSDIQLGMSLTAFIGSFILLGLGHIMGRLAR